MASRQVTKIFASSLNKYILLENAKNIILNIYPMKQKEFLAYFLSAIVNVRSYQTGSTSSPGPRIKIEF
jgi:hypothetical protein